MNCRSARARVFAAVDGTLAIEEVFELEQHVAECAPCRALWERARTLEGALARLSEPPADRIDVERSARAIGRAIEEVERAPRPRAHVLHGPLLRGAPWIAAAAAAALLLGLFVWSLGSERNTIPTSTPASVALDTTSVPTPALDPAPATVPELASAVEIVDPARLAEARGGLREILRNTSRSASSPAAPAVSAISLAQRVDGLALELARDGWPIVRLCESLIDDEDSAVACAAVRYLGVRGDRLSIAAIKRAREHGDLDIPALCALVDAGESESESVQAAIRDPARRGLVLAYLIVHDGPESTRALECALRATARTKSAADEQLARDVVDALVRLGDAAVPSVMRLTASRVLTEDEGLSALERTDGAADALARCIDSRSRDVPPALLLQAVARLRCTACVAWVAEMCQDPQHEVEALDALSNLGGTEALKSLFKLRLANTHAAAPLANALSRDGAAARDLALEWARNGNRRELKSLFDELSSNAARTSVPALAAIAESDLLSSSDRRWAVLLAGEVGAPEDAAAIEILLRKQKPRERELRAACLIAIHSLSGSEAVARVLEWASPRSSDRILALLDGRDARGKPASTLFKIARELEAVLTSPNL